MGEPVEPRELTLRRNPMEYASITLLVVGLLAGDTAIDIGGTMSVTVAPPLFIAAAVLALLSPAGRGGGAGASATLRTCLTLSVIYCWWLFLSLFWSESPRFGIAAAVQVALLLASVLATYVVVSSLGQRAWLPAWQVLFAAAVVFAVGGFLGDWITSGRMSAFGGGPNVFVRYMVIGTISVFFLYGDTGRKYLVAFVPLFLAAAVLSGSRGGMVALVIALAMIGFHLIRVKKVGFALGAAATVLALSALALSFDAVRTPVLGLASERFVALTVEERHASGRGELVQQSLEVIREKPVLGIGIGNFDYLYGVSTGMHHPHNIFLSTMVESGIFGLAILIVAVGVALALASARSAEFYSFVASAAILVCAQFSGYYYDFRLFWFFAFLALAPAGIRLGLPGAPRKESV